MVDEGKEVVDAAKTVTSPPAGEGEDRDGKHPETVPWSQYVGIKEKFTRVETELTGKVTSLEEQLKGKVGTEEHTKIKTELESTKAELEKVSGELKVTQEKTLAEKRAVLIKRGIPEEQAKGLSEKELDNVNAVLATVKPKPDLGGGGGGESPAGAKSKMQSGFESLHPTK